MRNARRNSSKPDFQLKLDDGSTVMRRKTDFLLDGAYLFEDELEVKGVMTTKVVTCTAWLLELYELKVGELFFVSGEAHVRPNTKSFGVFYAPFTISQPFFKNARGRLVGVASNASLPAELTSLPIMFETVSTELPSGAEQVIEILNSGEHRQSIELNPKPSLLSLKAKRLIDENYLIYPSIARIAGRLNVTHEHLSRQFKRDYGMSPSYYLHQLRVADAPLLLAKGEEIIEVSQSVGYNDLSRFYKQFRKTTKTSPGACQAIMKPRRAPSGQS
jgi:AraC-like DNA-binding protein